MSMVMTVGVIVFWCEHAWTSSNATIAPKALSCTRRLRITCWPHPAHPHPAPAPHLPGSASLVVSIHGDHIPSP